MLCDIYYCNPEPVLVSYTDTTYKLRNDIYISTNDTDKDILRKLKVIGFITEYKRFCVKREGRKIYIGKEMAWGKGFVPKFLLYCKTEEDDFIDKYGINQSQELFKLYINDPIGIPIPCYYYPKPDSDLLEGIIMSDEDSDRDIIRKLKDIGLIKKRDRFDSYRVRRSAERFYIDRYVGDGNFDTYFELEPLNMNALRPEARLKRYQNDVQRYGKDLIFQP